MGGGAIRATGHGQTMVAVVPGCGTDIRTRERAGSAAA
jgi:hypothetical protein